MAGDLVYASYLAFETVWQAIERAINAVDRWGGTTYRRMRVVGDRQER